MALHDEIDPEERIDVVLLARRRQLADVRLLQRQQRKTGLDLVQEREKAAVRRVERDADQD